LKILGPHGGEILLAAGVIVAALGGFIAWLRRKPQDPTEVERKRRSHLNQIGRIVEGQILEIVEAPAEALPKRHGRFGKETPRGGNGGDGSRKLLFYSYSISGVTYETAQDITGLEERACLNRLVAGQFASVKYDPSNPSNSILVADDWSGLH
jgi:uncharacterized protein DUF3592